MRCLVRQVPLALFALLRPSAAIATTCDSLAPSAAIAAAERRPITAGDLIQLRDIGNAGDANPTSPIAVSPDGHSVAFQIRRADIAANGYCLGMYVLSIERPNKLVEIDRGGEPIMLPGLWFGAITPKLSGYLQVVQPQWSPDGKWVLYLRRDGGITQLWRARADGGGAEALTDNAVDVADFERAPSGDAILFRDRPAYTRMSADIEREGLRGFHYDERWQPDDDATRPIVFDREVPEVHRINLLSGEETAVAADAWHDAEDEHAASRGDGAIATIVPEDPANVVSLMTVKLTGTLSTSPPCTAPQCHGHLLGLWWVPGRQELIFLRQDGWAREDSSLYRWRPGAPTVDLLARARGLMTGCKVSESALLCMMESSVQPRHLISIDVRNGTVSTIFEPNPEFAALDLGAIRRLRWTTPHGMQAFGDLVMPPGWKSGERYPLVVVQYLSRGFLRGGTGDAYPIQLMATHGYAVLSVQDPGAVGALRPARSAVEVNKRDVIGAADAREGVSSIEKGVALAIATGAIDPDKLAITGLSDGAFKARFALLHSTLFKTALISSCCDDPTSDALLGSLNMSQRRSQGWPEIGDFANRHWSAVSLLTNVRDLDTPLLIQASSHEYLEALPTVMALQQHKKPVDLFVYPGEFHVPWQPAHRASIYQRDIDWLDFWLENKVPSDADPGRAAEIKRWARMQKTWQASLARRGRDVIAPKLRHPRAEANGLSPQTRGVGPR